MYFIFQLFTIYEFFVFALKIYPSIHSGFDKKKKTERKARLNYLSIKNEKPEMKNNSLENIGFYKKKKYIYCILFINIFSIWHTKHKLIDIM